MATSFDNELTSKRARSVSDRHAFLKKPFARATLAEHRELDLNLKRTGYPFEDEVLRFLGVDDTQVTICHSDHATYELPQIHHALAQCFPDWKVMFEGGADRYNQLWATKDRRIEIAPGRFREYLSDGTRFYLLPDGGRRIVLFEESGQHPGREFQFSLIGPRADRAAIRNELRAMKRWSRRHHYLRGQALRADGTLLRNAPRLTWDDVVLDEPVRRSLLVNVVDFLRLREVFKQNGVPQKRGVLLYGPPGTGKTLIGKVLAGLGGTTFIYVTAGDVRNPGALRMAFKLARRLRPVIIFLEDLDFYAADRISIRDQSVLGELLAQMDGLERNDGLVVLATTNDLAAIEPALKDRPSRFDVVLEVGLPSTGSRRQLLAKYLGKAPLVAGEALDEAVAASDGLSGAQLREVALATTQAAILRGAIDGAGHAQPTAEDLSSALTQITGRQRRRPIGF